MFLLEQIKRLLYYPGITWRPSSDPNGGHLIKFDPCKYNSGQRRWNTRKESEGLLTETTRSRRRPIIGGVQVL